jgi:hypothetical protein
MEVGWIDTPEEWTMFFLMCYCVAGTLTFLAATFFILVTGTLSTGLLARTRGLVNTSVAPTLENVRVTSENVRDASKEVRTTVSFVSDYVVIPVIRVYATVEGARRFVAVFSRRARRE